MPSSKDPVQMLKESPELAGAAVAVALGLVMLFVGIASATTGLFRGLLGLNGAIQLGGVLAGLSVPSLIVGVWLLLPSTSSQKIGVSAGLAVAVIGLALFLVFYPDQWFGDPTDFTSIVALVYSVGVLVLLGYLFVGVANLQTQPQQETSRMSRRPVTQQRGPKSGTEVLKDIIMRKVRGEEEVAEDASLKLENVKETLIDEMTEANFLESVEVDDEEDLLILGRHEEVSHPQFTAGLPTYLSVESQDGNKYRVQVDEDSFYLSHPEQNPGR